VTPSPFAVAFQFGTFSVGRLQGRLSLISLSFPRARRATADGHAERIRTKSLHVPKTSYFLM